MGALIPSSSRKARAKCRLPLPTKTSSAPAFRTRGYSRCTCTACSRQKSQPKWRRKKRTTGCAPRCAGSRCVRPSRSSPLASAAAESTTGPSAGRVMLWRHPHLGEHEGVVEGDLPKPIVAPGGASVTGPHVRLQHQGVPVGLEGPQLRDVLGRLPVHDLRGVEGGLHGSGGGGLAGG